MSVYELSSSENVPGAFHGPEAMKGMWAGVVSGGCGACVRVQRRVKREDEQVGDGHERLEGVRM